MRRLLPYKPKKIKIQTVKQNLQKIVFVNPNNFFLTFFIFLCGISLSAQNPNLGIPLIHSYARNSFQSGARNFDIDQDNNGVLYFANNSGLLSYNGSISNNQLLPNATIAVSVALTTKNEVYAGGQNEFGKLVYDENGNQVFESLKHLIPENHRGFEDVWEIETIENKVYFRASNKLYVIEDEKCTVVDERVLDFVGKSSGQIIVQDLQEGLFYYKDGKLSKAEGTDALKGKLISEILETSNGAILMTFHDGLFTLNEKGCTEFKTDADDFLKQNKIISADRAKNGQLALGTDFAGVLIMSPEGKSLLHLDSKKGLLNNKIGSTFFDKNQNLWVGSDFGINQIELNSPFSKIYPDGESEGAGFTAKIHKGNIYFGSNNGLYVKEWKTFYDPFETAEFKLVKNTKGQNWGLDIVGDDLFLGHNDGCYLVEGNSAELIYNASGVWNAAKLKSNPDYAIAGTYKNFSLFKNENEEWTHLNDFEDWNESSRFVEQDKFGNIWMAHPYKGIFKINLNESLTKLETVKYGKNSGLPSDILNHLFKINDQIVFCGERGSFLFNYETESFESYELFNKLFTPNVKIRRLQEVANGDIWFMTNDNLGFLKKDENGLFQKIVYPYFKYQLNSGFESIYSYDEKNIFITTDNGFLHYNPSFDESVNTNFELMLNEVRLLGNNDSLVFAGFQLNHTDVPEFKADENAFRFKFSGIEYSTTNHVQYSYKLEGLETEWSNWTHAMSKDYTNLGHGNYTFKVKGINRYNVESPGLEYSFNIKRPWYKSPLAFLLYLFLFGSILYWIINKYQKKYYGLKKDRDETIKVSAQKIGKLEEEKRQAESEYKQRELISTTMHLVQKNEMIDQIKEKLSELKADNKDQNFNKKIQKLINMLQMDEVVDDGWKQFMLHFNQLHGDFYNRLNKKYPTLTPKDLKLCTYLRMNLSTKEIATLMSISTRGVEASRYRLRKKIMLDKDQNLTEFMMKF